jgi:UDP-glucose 4-epimerase
VQEQAVKKQTDGILVTGANGFLGRGLVAHLMTLGYTVRTVVRQPRESTGADELVKEIHEEADWSDAFLGISTVIHTAARVHVMRETTINSEVEFYRTNVAGTLSLARQAVKNGVKRFIFLSSIKVNGDVTFPGDPFRADGPVYPSDAYARSKQQAEVELLNLGCQTGLEVVIIRPPLVYGPGVKANFYSMLKWVEKGIPLPFGSIHNQRSLVAVSNLIDLLTLCISHPKAAGEVFLVSDGSDLSTTELLRTLAEGMSRPARLIPVPSFWLKSIASSLGRNDLAIRLCGSLQVDIQKTRDVLNWTPFVSAHTALKQVAKYYLEAKK